MIKLLSTVVIFLGAFLLFGVQPMLGRTLLPSFGGTAAVWTTCLATFQLLLLAGYYYAHLIVQKGLRAQRGWHLILLGGAVAWTLAFAGLRPLLKAYVGHGACPALEVLLCVLAFVGFPYVLLSANSTLVQAWLAAADDGIPASGLAKSAPTGTAQGCRPVRNVYRLYAVSNLGSFCGLLFYPFILEPYVSLTFQWYGFAALLTLYAALLAGLSNKLAGLPACVVKRNDQSRQASWSGGWALRKQSLWLVLPAASVFLLNAVTAHLTLDVMPLPFLWVLLLALFLLSYVIGFKDWAERWLYPLGILVAASVAAVAATKGMTGSAAKFMTSLGACCALCLVGCTFIHAWLYSLRPNEAKLTRYYLCNSAGGATGGLCAALVAPLVFRSVMEFPIAIALTLALAGLYMATAPLRPLRRGLGLAAVAGVGFLGVLAFLPKTGDRPVVYRNRGFFGTIQILEAKARTATGEGVIHEFVHGTTVHGIQALLPGKERMPTTYYTPNAGGYAIIGHPKYRTGEPMRVNIVGMGVGVMLCYARTNDYYRTYEISRDVVAVARDTKLFTFVSGCSGKVDLAVGDARKGLERERAAGVEPYDVIQIDAFTGDNLPYHLSTKEAFDLYFSLLKPDGILAVNISNWHLDLAPFIKALADHYKVPLLGLRTENDFAKLGFGAKFVFFCRDPSGMAPLPQEAQLIDFERIRPMKDIPLDEKGSFINLVNF